MPLGVFVFGDFGVFDDFGDLPFGVFALRILFEAAPSRPPRDKAFSLVKTSSIANESTIASTAVIKFQIRIFLKDFVTQSNFLICHWQGFVRRSQLQPSAKLELKRSNPIPSIESLDLGQKQKVLNIPWIMNEMDFVPRQLHL